MAGRRKRAKAQPSPRTRRDARHSTGAAASAKAARERDHETPNEFEAWQAALTPREKRIDEIVGLMAQGSWMAGASHRELARQWGVTPGTVEHLAAEANRILRRNFRQDESARSDLLATVLQNFEVIRVRGMLDKTPAGLRVALEATKSLGQYLGIEPPKNVKLTTQDEFEALTDEQLAAVAEGGIEALRGMGQAN